jgi:hypothetical protein
MQDLDALAAQFGGQPAGGDLDALASQFGGQSQEAMQPVASHGETPDKFEQDFPGWTSRLKQMDREKAEATPKGVAMAAGLMAGPGIVGPAIAAGGTRYLMERLGGKSREDAAGAGVTEGVSSGAFGAATKVPGLLGKLGRRAIKGSLKVDRGYLEKMATARKQGLMGAEDEIVDTVLAQPGRRNVLTHAGADRLQGRLNEAGAARQAKIQAAPDVPVAHSGAAQGQTLNRRLTKELDATQSEGVDATRKVLRDLSANPKYGANAQGELRDLTPQELARRVEADNADLRSMFGREQAPGLEAVKAVRGINAKMLDRAAGTKADSQQMKKLIDLRNVTNIARRRGEARDVIGITDVVSLSAGRPEVLGATTAMRPAVQMQIGLVLDKLRRGIPLQGTAVEREALKAIAQSLMASGHESEQP